MNNGDTVQALRQRMMNRVYAMTGMTGRQKNELIQRIRMTASLNGYAGLRALAIQLNMENVLYATAF